MAMTGGCLCGKLRYTIDDGPVTVGKCYCGDCHLESGTGHMTFVSVPSDMVRIAGEAQRFVKAGGSGTDVERLFCPSCGTTIVGYPKALGDVAAVRAGTLDDPAAISPTFAVFGGRALPWDAPPADIRVFETVPSR
jgi:hypothetical protein